jgi:signal peptidase I
MKNYIKLNHSFDLIVSLLVTLGILLVVQTFIIGHHYIIPTGILMLSVIFGNLVYYGFKNNRFAKKILFWLFFVFTLHLFFALFFSVKYRTILGNSFEPVCIINILVFSYLLIQYERKNNLF